MNFPLRSWKRFTCSTAAAFMGLLMAPAAQAQCPAITACVPGSASNANAALFGMGIANVTLRSGTTALINNATGGEAEGYVDYGCFTPSIAATLLVGQSYTLVVTNSTNAVTENVRAWIDYSNDGVLDASELVLTSNTATTHTATFTPPATAALGTALRLRVSSDYSNAPVPTACSTPQFSQVEDYSITLSANSNPPVAAFTTNGLITCSGCVQFTDASQNVPTSWAWDFGDGQTSTQQSPSHCYATAGTYTVTLTTTNAAGSSASPATATVTYSTQVPVAASCSPATASYCCNYGVTRFRLGTIDNTSADGSAGYQDFTCPQRTQLTVGTAYPMTITLGNTSANQDTRVYLDLNNDGILTAAELIYEAIGQASPTTNLTLPGTTTTNQPLRLRIVTDAGGNNPQPCTSPVSGQVEDYTVIAVPNTSPPVADFTSNYVAGSCVNPIQFTDATSGAPTSWAWDFGDGQTSTQQNPSHQYAASGTYTVSLTATNNIGPNTVTRPSYLTVSVPCLVYCASNGSGMGGGGGGGQGSQFWITNVAVANAQPSAFTNPTVREATGYGNYTARTITVEPGTVNITVTTNLNFAHRTLVWIDTNQDGTLSNTTDELVVNGTTTNGPLASTYTTSFTPTAAAGSTMRMRVQCSLNNNTPNSCGVNINNAEVEDYTFRINPLATHEAHALPALTVYPNPTQDGRLHLSLADASAAGTYTATVENLLGARLLSTTLRLAPSADAELNLGPLAKGVYLLRLRDAQGQTALRRVVRE